MVIKTLDPDSKLDPDSVEMLDQDPDSLEMLDPDSMNSDPQNRQYVITSHASRTRSNHHGKGHRYIKETSSFFVWKRLPPVELCAGPGLVELFPLLLSGEGAAESDLGGVVRVPVHKGFPPLLQLCFRARNIPR